MFARSINFASAWFLLVSVGCAGESLETSEMPIVNGQVSATGAHPATVYLQMQFANQSSAGCTGTLIAPHVVLTAEHCVNGATEVDVFFGNNIGGEGTWISSTSHAVHPWADIAAVTIVEPGPATPVPIYRQRPSVGSSVLIVGFGSTGSQFSSGRKREGTTWIDGYWEEVMIIGESGSKTCFGDSGGPTFIDRSGVRYVTAVSSFVSNDDCTIGHSGNVRTDSFQAWIDSYVNSVGIPGCGSDGLCSSGCAAADPDCPCATDGHCSTACTDWEEDEDCASCAADGVCQMGCPVADVDCCGEDGLCQPNCSIGPDPDCSGIGAACAVDSHCESGLCERVEDTWLCSQSCASDAECPNGFQCLDGEACWPVDDVNVNPPGEGGCDSSGGASLLVGLAILALLGRLTCRRRWA